MRRLVVACSAAALLGACGTAPPTRFYALDAPATPAGVRELDGPTIAVGPVALPDAVDRAQIVTRRSANELAIEEFAHWAAPLNAQLSRIVADHLAALHPTARIAPASAAPAMPDYRVTLEVRRFELMPGEGTTLDVVWAVSGDGKTLRSARGVFNEASADPSFDALVAAQSRAVSRLARDIAAALPTR